MNPLVNPFFSKVMTVFISPNPLYLEVDGLEKQGSLSEREDSVQVTMIIVLTNLDHLILKFKVFFKQASLMRRSSVLSFSLHFVFPGKNMS